MDFNLIDRDNWAREEHFCHFFYDNVCSYSITANVDITEFYKKVKALGAKLYPSFIFLVSKVINSHQDFKMSIDENKKLGYFTKISPSFTIFHDNTKTFSNIWVDYCDDFNTFYERYEKNIKEFGDSTKLNPQKDMPKNVFPISSIPWVEFKSFNLNLFDDSKYLLPIVTGGKYFEVDQNLLLPVTLQIHHASCDGFGVGIFFNELQELCKNF